MWRSRVQRNRRSQLLATPYNHARFTRILHRKYEIGTVVDNELPVFPSRGDFFQTLKKVSRFGENCVDLFSATIIFPHFLPAPGHALQGDATGSQIPSNDVGALCVGFWHACRFVLSPVLQRVCEWHVPVAGCVCTRAWFCLCAGMDWGCVYALPPVCHHLTDVLYILMRMIRSVSYRCTTHHTARSHATRGCGAFSVQRMTS